MGSMATKAAHSGLGGAVPPSRACASPMVQMQPLSGEKRHLPLVKELSGMSWPCADEGCASGHSVSDTRGRLLRQSGMARPGAWRPHEGRYKLGEVYGVVGGVYTPVIGIPVTAWEKGQSDGNAEPVRLNDTAEPAAAHTLDGVAYRVLCLMRPNKVQSQTRAPAI